MKLNTFGEIYNKNILLMNKISADIKTVLIVIQNFRIVLCIFDVWKEIIVNL